MIFRKQMKNYLILILFLASLLVSCQSDDSRFVIGEDLVSSKTEISMVDSFSVQLSTIKIDSIVTSGTSTLLTGHFKNETSGSVEFNSYFNFDLSSNLSDITDEAVFDSLTIQLYYDGYLIGDSLQLQTLQVYRLTEQLKLRINDDYETYLFNTSHFEQEETHCGQRGFYPVASQDTIQVRLDDSFGQELLRMIKEETDEVANNDNFIEWLKGFVLKRTAAGNPATLGFLSDSMKMVLYTHTVDFELQKLATEFPLSTGDTHFNQVLVDRAGTGFDNMPGQREKLPSQTAGDISLIQASAGVLVRLDFPTLNEIFTLDRVLLKAELVLRPAITTFNNEMPAVLHFFKTERINQQGEQLTYTYDNTTYNTEAKLVEDVLYNENSYYVADITSFISSELAGYYYDINNGLLVSVPSADFLSKADHLILEGEKSARYQPKLNLYFLTYE